MTDYFAWEKFGGDLKSHQMAYVGDGNNMATRSSSPRRRSAWIAVATPRTGAERRGRGAGRAAA
jgi:ornithine carbamoyltransferase